jgi:hypothetical protein
VNRTPAGLRELARRQAATLGLPNDPSLYRVEPQPMLRGTSARELFEADRAER